ncbi:MAG: FAD-dependent oxidoreductase [Bacteriovoracaceae bacterium]
MSIEYTEFLIIGCGPAGIGAAYKLKELGISNYTILEKSDVYGGLATSYLDNKGFTWDIGGHVQFSHYEYFDKAMLDALGADGWLHHQRESWVWIYDRFVPYPFQNNIHRLPPQVRDECLNGLKSIQTKEKTSNFKDWIQSNFGNGIAKHFLFPYNFKVWAYEPESMNSVWVGERVSPVDISRIEENIKHNRDDVSWGPNNTFQFPLKGGTGAIWKSLSQKIGLENIKLNTEVLSIDNRKKIVTTTDGRKFSYKHLLSTMPLDQFCKKIQNIPDQIIKSSSKFRYSSTHVIGIGLKGKPNTELKTKCWMYFPENNCPFYRVTLFSNYSPNNVPQSGGPYFSLMAEVSESVFKKVRRDTIIEDTIQGLINTKLISNQDIIVSKWHFHAPYGYPTPFLERDQLLKEVISYLDEQKLYSRGRFGGWKYEVSNQDHTFMQGAEWADFIVNHKSEVTFRL